MKRSLKQSLKTSTRTWQWRTHLLICSHSISVLTEKPMTQMKETMPINQFSLMKLINSSVSSYGFASSAPLFAQFNHFIDSELCNSVIRSYTHLNKHVHSVFVYTQMCKAGISPDSSTFPAVLKSVTKLGRGDIGKSIHCCVVKMGFVSDLYTNTALVHMYCTCLLPGEGRQVFDVMPERNAVSWNALISGYAHNRKFREAIDAFRDMQAAGAKPGEVTMVGVLSACSHLGALNQGKWIHDYIVRNKLRLNVFVGTALIDMYAKCGVVDEAQRVFGAVRVKNVYTWNVLISGYAMNGQGEAALQAFETMIVENYRPDEVTFLGILCACCHQGLVEVGRRHLRNMKEEYGLNPRIEHYGCMVDLLGRAGLFVEAQELMHTMNMKPDPIIWRAFLGACRIHGHTQLGETAIKNLIELEPENGENYILLSNLYARDHKWSEVGEVREIMNRGGIRKVPGCSSIEIENAVYEFVVSNLMGPGYEELYKLLANVKRELKVAGYAEYTDMVSYDIEEEEKEQTLTYHSEKLALAFGLLNSLPDTTLRILKNLRICQDCHQFFKLVSELYRRDITVRDRNRFHHFSGGVCSCKDYW
ncbi:Pentatricopeptide repeat-containing protein [Actinidia chinensis var. chinensis]|uniref:Pentatricopeptide repeat-containing protein n=1 Tax=Actinidia chinensis var. chinensis TaxID=1590841 RepID=A0A2R6PCT2_ACTCC|nr:Pentatricopeptide repeat-containing protein [Actinidia chinensis var. chinensis]